MNKKVILFCTVILLVGLLLCACGNGQKDSHLSADNSHLDQAEKDGTALGGEQDQNTHDGQDDSGNQQGQSNDDSGNDSEKKDDDLVDNIIDLGNGLQVGAGVDDWDDNSDGESETPNGNTDSGKQNEGQNGTGDAENDAEKDPSQPDSGTPDDSGENADDNTGENPDGDSSGNAGTLAYDPNDLLTYDEFIALSPYDQQAYFETFPSLEIYAAWYNYAKEQYEADKDITEVEPGGSIDIGDFMN